MQEIAGLAKKRVVVKKQNPTRRVSMLGGKLLPAGNDGVDELPTISTHGIMKLDKAIMNSFPKISTFASIKHPFFGSGVYALASKTGLIAIVQVGVFRKM